MDCLESGGYKFKNVNGWGTSLQTWDDASWGLRKVPGVAVDSKDNVYILSRSDKPILVTDKNGTLIRTISGPQFARPHGITIDENDNIFYVDDLGNIAYKITPQDAIEFTLGEFGKCTETGCTSFDYRTINRAAGPFNRPTNLAVAPSGDLFISDGYGNARVHRFSRSGELIISWGEPGNKPGQFFLPHGILVSKDGIVYVADRENNRVQLFDEMGNFIDEWRDLIRPSDLKFGPDGHIYLLECKRCNVFDVCPSRLSILTTQGELIARFDNRQGYLPFEHYHAAHGLAIDSEGSVYIGEVGDPPLNYIGIKKYARIN
jgi:DNA-binding beta-propeller fold protein YncE